MMFERTREDEFIDADELQLLLKDLGRELQPEQEGLDVSSCRWGWQSVVR